MVDAKDLAASQQRFPGGSEEDGSEHTAHNMKSISNAVMETVFKLQEALSLLSKLP